MASCSARRREGGASAVLMEMGRQLEQLGHRVEILFQEDLPRSRFLPRRFEELDFAIELARHILQNPTRYDVVDLRAPTGCVYGLARKFRGRRKTPPYVAELTALEERRVYAIREETRKGRGWENRWKNKAWHRVYHLPRFRAAVRSADRVVCANREVWSYLQLVYGLHSNRVTYLPHGVDSRFIRARDYAAIKAPRLLYVGTWLDQRGTQYIGEAIGELAKQLPGTSLTVAGSMADADKVLSSFPIEARELVNVIPIVPSSEMPEIYASHDIFLFPSFFEALPLVLLEAMAGGMPVITTETCGMMDAVRDEWNGLLIPPGDSGAIVRAVLRLSAEPELRRRLGMNAQETGQWFSWERMARKLEGVFERLVNESRAELR